MQIFPSQDGKNQEAWKMLLLEPHRSRISRHGVSERNQHERRKIKAGGEIRERRFGEYKKKHTLETDKYVDYSKGREVTCVTHFFLRCGFLFTSESRQRLNRCELEPHLTGHEHD